VPHATYRNHRGHAEAIETIFDTSKVTYRDLLEFFFQIRDPSTLNCQGNDIGTSSTARPFSTLAKGKSVSLEIRLQTLMRRVSGQERSLDRTVSYHRPSTWNTGSLPPRAVCGP
jgi:peptide methionine sulfoxide reductase MsrA